MVKFAGYIDFLGLSSEFIDDLLENGKSSFYTYKDKKSVHICFDYLNKLIKEDSFLKEHDIIEVACCIDGEVAIISKQQISFNHILNTMTSNLITSKNHDEVMNFGQNSLVEGQRFLSVSLDNKKLSSFSENSALINDLCQYVDFYSNDKKKWFDTIPFFGEKLKGNRFNNMTINDAVNVFSREISNASMNVVGSIKYSRTMILSIDESVEKANNDLLLIEKQLETGVENSYAEYMKLKMIEDKDRTDLENDNLWSIEQNVSTIQGTRVALTTLIGSLKMKKSMLKKIVDAGIKIQAKAKQCQCLPAIMQSALDIMQVSNVLSKASGSLGNTEQIVKALVLGAGNSVNGLTEHVNQIKELSINFNDVVNSLKDVKNDCEEILLNVSPNIKNIN